MCTQGRQQITCISTAAVLMCALLFTTAPAAAHQCCCRLATSLQTLDLRNTNVNGSLPGITRAQRAAGLVPEERLCGSDAAGLARAINLQVRDAVICPWSLKLKCSAGA
jgi:hypothetical protein